jgi:hypothetical protein
MPKISRFLGILVFMNWRDHNPAHFHARYGDYEISVMLDNLLVKGEFPRRALLLVLEWAQAHQAELKQNWGLIQQGKAPHQIQPLE